MIRHLTLWLTLAAGPLPSATWTLADAPAPAAVSTADPEIPIDRLKTLIKPLTTDELVAEADA